MTREDAKHIGVTTLPNRGLEYIWYENYLNKIDEIYDHFEPLEKMYNILKQQKEDLIEGQEILIKAHDKTIEDYMSRTCESCKFNYECDVVGLICDNKDSKLYPCEVDNTVCCNLWESK
jgi:hypothetical protein